MATLTSRPVFQKLRCGEPYINLRGLRGEGPSITSLPKRPAFRIGEQIVPLLQPSRPQLPEPPRKVSTRIIRPSFKLRGPKPRALKTISGIEALRVKQEGIKVRLGDKQLGKIRVQKKDAAGNLVFDLQGQPVMEEVPVNFGLLAEIMQGGMKGALAKIAELEVLIRSGGAAAALARGQLMTALIILLSRDENLAEASAQDFEALSRATRTALVPSDPREARIADLVDGRFVTLDTWSSRGGENQGFIHSFLLANFAENPRLRADRPVIGVGGHPITFRSVGDAIRGRREGRGSKVLDLVSKQMFTDLADARAFALASAPPISELKEFEPEEEDDDPEFPQFEVEHPFAPPDRSMLERLIEEEQRQRGMQLVPQPAPFDPSNVTAEELLEILRLQQR